MLAAIKRCAQYLHRQIPLWVQQQLDTGFEWPEVTPKPLPSAQQQPNTPANSHTTEPREAREAVPERQVAPSFVQTIHARRLYAQRQRASVLGRDVQTGRAEQMIHLAMQLAQFRMVGDINLVVLVAEAWASPAREPFMIPSKDPNRCDVLVINALDGQTQEQQLLLFTCIREQNGVVTGLKPLPVPASVSVESPLLRAFLTGYRLAQSSLPAEPLERDAYSGTC